MMSYSVDAKFAMKLMSYSALRWKRNQNRQISVWSILTKRQDKRKMKLEITNFSKSRLQTTGF